MAETNTQEFRVGLRDAAARLKVDRRDLTRAVAMRGLRGVVLGTRVDTGRARGNWQVGEGVPPEGYQEFLFDPDGGTTIARGSEVIKQASGDLVIWLHNGVPYIGFLEDLDRMVEGNVQAIAMWLDSQPSREL